MLTSQRLLSSSTRRAVLHYLKPFTLYWVQVAARTLTSNPDAWSEWSEMKDVLTREAGMSYLMKMRGKLGDGKSRGGGDRYQILIPVANGLK